MTTASSPVAWQRRAAALLGELLARAEAEYLPVLDWQIASRRALLTGHSLALTQAERRAAIAAWGAALGASTIEEREAVFGITTVTTEAPHYDGLVTVVITTTLADVNEPP
jgi:hypothetical protein